MEYLILFGGLLSVPIIHYCNQPSPPSEASKPAESTQEANPVAKPLSDSELEALKQKASERQARILNNLTASEQALLKDYLANLKNPKKDPESLNLLISLVLFSLLFLLILSFFIYFDNSDSSKPSDL